nr:MAG TPA: hypothetical protein [Caudoviricetes sp.]
MISIIDINDQKINGVLLQSIKIIPESLPNARFSEI